MEEAKSVPASGAHQPDCYRSFWWCSVVSRPFTPDLQACIKSSAKIIPFHQGVPRLQRSHTQNMTLNRPVWDFNKLLPSMCPLHAPVTFQGGKVHAQTGPEVINPYEWTLCFRGSPFQKDVLARKAFSRQVLSKNHVRSYQKISS